MRTEPEIFRLARGRAGLLALVSSSLALSACQTQQQTAALQCGLGSAAVAYLACKAAGGNDSKCALLAGGTGVVGAGVCFNYADRLVKRQEALKGQENNLDARIKYVRGLNEDSTQLVKSLNEQLVSATQRTDDLVAKVKQSKITQAQLAQEKKKLQDELNLASAQVGRGEEALKEVKAYRAERRPNSSELDAAIAQQERLLVDARRQVAQLAAQNARV